MWRVCLWSENGETMNYEDNIVCPQCSKVNPVECDQAGCPMEQLFWEDDD